MSNFQKIARRKESSYRKFSEKNVKKMLETQGFELENGKINSNDKSNLQQETLRELHREAKQERLIERTNFIERNANLIKGYTFNKRRMDIKNIRPKLKVVLPNTYWEKIYRWWNLVWWSLPYERAYGRQMRYVVWDEHHKAAIGLIGLHSPILSWAPRDKYLDISYAARDYWVNQSMSAQRLGAIPPYNRILGGKLVSMLMTSDKVRNDFRKKYKDKKTLMKGRILPPHLLFITTTGAFGKSSIYSRLKFHDEPIAKFIGYSTGSGSFHIPNNMFEQMLNFLHKHDINTDRGFGSGPSRKMRLISQGMKMIGYRDGQFHNIKRAIYFFPLASNLKKLIAGENKRPLWYKRSLEDLSEFWKTRWAVKRSEKDLANFDTSDFIDRQIREIIKSRS